MSRSVSKINGKSSIQKEMAFRNRRAQSVDNRSRGSYVFENKRSSSEERKSGYSGHNRWSNSRKSSINLSDAKRKDNRPLTDKAYQKRKISDLIQFLEQTNFMYPISIGKLSSPSKKDFENIFQHLYSYLDPAYEVKKIEEEAPKILKNLGYPVNVNKSAFVYVARTNWPSLLGVLIFLMDLYKFAMKVDLKAKFEIGETGEDEQKAALHSILLRYICQCYHSGIDNEEEENSMFIHIIKSNMKNDLADIVSKNEEKKLLVHSVEKEMKEMKELSEQIKMQNKNMVSFEEYIEKMKCRYTKKNEECEKIVDQLKEKESQLNSLKEVISKQQDQYDAQGYDGIKQLDYFESLKKELLEKFEAKCVIFRELQSKLWESEIQFKKNSDQTTAVAESFNDVYVTTIERAKTVLQPLQNLKITSIQKLCSNYHLDFPAWEMLASEKHPGHNENKIGQELFCKLQHTNEILKNVSALQNQKLSEKKMQRSDLLAQMTLLSAQETRKKHDLNSKERQADDEISSLELDLQKVDKTVQTLRNESLELDKTCREMNTELKYLEKRQEMLKKTLQEYLSKQQVLFQYFSEKQDEVEKQIMVYANDNMQKLKDLTES